MHTVKEISTDKSSAQLTIQLDFLKIEIETINASIRQIDEITKSLKQWTIVTWTGAVGGALVTPGLTNFVVFTSVIPILFWVVDGRHRQVQRKFIWRTLLIKDFLNDERLEKSIKEGRLIGFKVLDPRARDRSIDDEKAASRLVDYRKFTGWRVMLFGTVSLLYGGLAILSLFIWLLNLKFGWAPSAK
jgi:hypothetical protein